MPSPSPTARRVLAAAALTGAVAAGVQVTLLRELLVASGGDELSAGLGLTCWMLGGALGSVAAAQLRSPARWLPASLALLAAAAPVALVLVHAARGALGPPPGEIVTPLQALAIAGLALAPPAAMVGASYPLLTARLRERGDGRAAARVFLFEGLGFAAGGALHGCLLAVALHGVWTLALFGATAAAACGLVASGRKTVAWLAAAAVAAGVVAARPLTGRSLVFPDREVVAIDSVHGRLESVHHAGQHDVYVDGLWAFAYPDTESAEWSVHPAALAHPAPRRVLLLGGAVSGALDPLLEHPAVAEVDAVEVDPRLVSLVRAELPAAASAALDDPRITVHLADPRAFLRTGPAPYDLVLLLAPDARSTQLNRLVSQEYFHAIAAALADDGVLALVTRGSAELLGPLQARQLARLRNTLAAVFPVVELLPGPRVTMLAAATPAAFDADALAERLRARDLTPRHVRPFELAFELSALRRDYLVAALDEAGAEQPNRDLVPRSFQDNRLLDARARAPALVSVWQHAERVGPGGLAAGIAVACVTLAVIARLRRRRTGGDGASIVGAVLITGATGIVVELALILGYQVAFGQLFARVGAIVAAYMGGLALGAWLVARRPPASPRAALTAVQGMLAAGCGGLALAAITDVLSHLPPATQVLFGLLTAVFGLLAGAQFALALACRADRPAAPGRLYAADLAGAAGAALLASLLWLPLIGVPATLALLALANAGGALALRAGRPPTA